MKIIKEIFDIIISSFISSLIYAFLILFIAILYPTILILGIICLVWNGLKYIGGKLGQ